MNNKVRFAVIGCGHVGMRHAAEISSNPDCVLMALTDIREASSLEINDYDVPFFSSLDEMLKSNPGIDVVSIATPNGLHEEQAIKVLNAGYHVVIEKPMALSKEGCQRIITAAVAAKKQVFCVMQNRYSPPSVWLKEITEKKLLGTIFMVQINCFWNRDERYYIKGNWHGTREMDGGVLFTQFSHFIDTLLWLFGDIKNIRSRFANFNHRDATAFDDTGIVNFDLERGGMGSINFSTAVWKENLESSITIIAEKGTVKIGGQYMNEVQYCNIMDYTIPALPTAHPANHHYIIKNVADVLNGRASLAINAGEGLKTVETIEKIMGRIIDQAKQ